MIDLHVHSNCSDGTLSPSELVHLAVQTGLSAFALTDHDTMAGVTCAKQEAALLPASTPLTVIAGTEISSAYKSKDIHILGLFVNEKSEALQQALSEALAARDRRNEEMVHRFEKENIFFTLDDLRVQNPNTVITRAHFAKYLAENHYVKSREEAFARYLNHDAPCFVPRTYMEPERAVTLIREAGGIPVLAHPLLYKLEKEELCALIERLCAVGLQGLETYYSSYTVCEQNIVAGLANRYRLVKTGGTDFHGANKPGLFLGTGRNNNLNIPDSVLEDLKALLSQ